MLTRKSLLLTSKSKMLTRKSLLLTSKSEMLARKSLFLIADVEPRKWLLPPSLECTSGSRFNRPNWQNCCIRHRRRGVRSFVYVPIPGLASGSSTAWAAELRQKWERRIWPGWRSLICSDSRSSWPRRSETGPQMTAEVGKGGKVFRPKRVLGAPGWAEARRIDVAFI